MPLEDLRKISVTGPPLKDLNEKITAGRALSNNEIKRLLDASNHANPFQRAKGITLLSRLPDAKGRALAARVARTKLRDKEGLVRFIALQGLCRTKPLDAQKAAATMTRDPYPKVRELVKGILTSGNTAP